ncbi:hypothetical protein ACV3RW_15825 [Clostridium perfringens]
MNNFRLTPPKINGELLHKDAVVARIDDNKLIITDKHMLPSYFKLGGDLKTWLENRCIDTRRINSRLLRKMVNIRTSNKIDIVLSVNAHTLTDNYWIRLSSDGNLKYKNIAYSNDLLFNTALFGDTSIIDNKNLKDYRSPNLTLGGSFEKGWKLKNGKWYLVKSGNRLNNSVELIASYLSEYFGFNHAKYYKFNEDCVYCENFTDNLKYDFEPMFDFLGYEDNFELSIDYIGKINIAFVKDFLNMMFLDAILLNLDRHTKNYGFLRNSNTGEFVGLAPIFDNNLALFATKQNINDLDFGNKEIINKFYIQLLKKYDYTISNLQFNDLKDIISLVYNNFKPINYSVEFTTDFIFNKYTYIKNRLNVN